MNIILGKQCTALVIEAILWHLVFKVLILSVMESITNRIVFEVLESSVRIDKMYSNVLDKQY